MWRRVALAALAGQLVLPAAGQRVRGEDWLVCYNLPSQDPRGPIPGELAIRDTLLEQVARLQRGHAAGLATYTFSGDSDAMGAAGPLLVAVGDALGRGAAILFVIDSNVPRTRRYGPAGHSLSRLAQRSEHPLALAVAPTDRLMHHKLGVFDFGGHDTWTFSASWNFTGGASIFQWNIGILLRSEALYTAMAAELEEFRAGRFGAAKRRGHDGTRFRLRGAWADAWVRFGPYPAGTTDAETDIVRLINAAEREIFFALNKLNRPAIRDAMVAAAERGVAVTGVIPASDLEGDRYAVSGPTREWLADPNNFRQGRPVRFLAARVRDDDAEWDAGQRDLVHTKYMVIDPGTWRPVVIHGSANWTAAGLASPDGNDEHILFLPHRELARAFMEQFHRMTGEQSARGRL